MKKLQNLGKTLSKVEQKRIIGRNYGGTCCAHTADWSYWSVCGLSKSEAQAAASNYASSNNCYAYWCCDSCPS